MKNKLFEIPTSLVVVTVLAALCGGVAVQIGGYPFALQPLLLGFFLVVVLLGESLGIYAFLGMVLIYPLLPERSLEVAFQRPLDAWDLLFALALAGFTGFSFRYLSFRRSLSWFDDSPVAGVPNQSNAQIRPLAGRWHYLLIALITAIVLLGLFPLDANMPAKIGLLPHGARAITFGWLLFFAWFVLTTLFSLLSWWRMDSATGNIYVRNVLATELNREQSPIERRRAKIINKTLAKR